MQHDSHTPTVTDRYRLPNNYEPLLNAKQTQNAITKLRHFFEKEFGRVLNVHRVESPIMIRRDQGLADTIDRDTHFPPVSFTLENGGDPIEAEIVQAATKWKRVALKQFDCAEGEGIVTDMRAIRRVEVLGNYHSGYVDQWDWERAISAEQRSLAFLKEIVGKIWQVMRASYTYISAEYPILKERYGDLPETITFVHSEDLLDMYPELEPNDREIAFLKEYPAAFLCGVGYKLNNGKPHGARTADYDDWITEVTSAEGRTTHGLNGDIIVWNPVTQSRHELSSMGIRVDKDSLKAQLEYTGESEFLKSNYSQMILNDDIPLSVGGGIGQSRLWMYLLRKAALGECSISVWPESFYDACAEKNIPLLR